jgi:hypothetical protein
VGRKGHNMDPSKMSDEELKDAIKLEETPINEEPVETPKEEPLKEEPPKEPEAPVEEDGQGEEEEPQAPEPVEAPPMSRREQLRVADLLKKYPDLKQEPAKVAGVDFRNKVEADDDTYKTLEDTTQQYGQAQFNAGLEQAKSIQFHTRLEIDAPRVEAKYPRLDPNSEQFDKEAANDMYAMYTRMTGYDAQNDTVAHPNIRWIDFADAQMNLARRIAAEQSVESSKNIAKQAAQTGLRPDGSTSKKLNLNKAPGQMTDEELKAVIAQAGM